MAQSTYELRMQENSTRYPFSHVRPNDYDVRYLPRPWLDSHTRRPLLEIGEPNNIPQVEVPVIFLATVIDPETKMVVGRLHETRYVSPFLMRFELHPQRLAVYATPEAYEQLGLPVRDHRIHDTIPKSRKEYEQLRKRWSWDNEPWKHSFEYLFRKYEDGPAELRDVEEEWDGSEDVVDAAGAKSGTAAGKKGPAVMRKARKVKLF
jgi:hypothetical protein